MNVNYYISAYPSLLQDMVAKIYEVDTTGATAEVSSITIPERNGAGVPTPGAGHQVPYHVIFNGLDKVTHMVRLYTAGGTLLHFYDVMPTTDIVTVFDPIRFRIGDGGTYTPVAGAVNYTNPAMAGLVASDYIAIRTGYGPVVEGIHIANNILGGFDLVLAGDIFSGDPAEEWTIIMQPVVVSTPVNDSVVGKQWGPTSGNVEMFVDVNSNVSYDPAIHLRKLIRLSGNAAAFHFGAVDIPPVGYVFRFTNTGAYTLITDTPVIYFDNAALISGNTTVSSFSMPYGSVCEFTFDGTYWNKSIINIGVPVPPVTVAILGRGLLNIGDVPAIPTGYLITHNLNVVGDYLVLLSKKSNYTSDHSRDIKVNEVWWHDTIDKPNRFYIGVAELTGIVQNLQIAWVVIQL